MTKALIAHFDGKVFVPDEPVEVPVGCKVALTLEPLEEKEALTGLARLAAMAKDLPEDPDDPVDGAAQHDHYLYGTPKR